MTKDTADLRELLKDTLNECELKNYLHPKKALGGSAYKNAPSELAKEMIKKKIEMTKLYMDICLIGKPGNYHKKIKKLEDEITELKSKTYYQKLLKEYQIDMRKAIAEHNRYWS